MEVLSSNLHLIFFPLSAERGNCYVTQCGKPKFIDFFTLLFIHERVRFISRLAGKICANAT